MACGKGSGGGLREGVRRKGQQPHPKGTARAILSVSPPLSEAPSRPLAFGFSVPPADGHCKGVPGPPPRATWPQHRAWPSQGCPLVLFLLPALLPGRQRAGVWAEANPPLPCLILTSLPSPTPQQPICTGATSWNRCPCFFWGAGCFLSLLLPDVPVQPPAHQKCTSFLMRRPQVGMHVLSLFLHAFSAQQRGW